MSKTSFPRRFLRGLWNTITRIRMALANIFFLLMLVALYFVFAGGAPQPLPEKAALLFNPMGSIVDQVSPMDPLQALLSEPSPADHEIALRDVIEAIETARDDPAINSLVMDLSYLMSIGISKTQELVDVLEAFRASGKPIVATGDYYTQDQYLLASYADEILVHPLGGVGLEGYALYPNFYRDALEKLSVNVHVFRAGEHKSAVEPFMRNDMSQGEKEVNLAWLQDLWQQYTGSVEQQRDLPLGAVDDYVNNFASRLEASGGDTAAAALEAGLVDQVISRSAANDYLAQMVGATNEDDLFEAVPFDHYLARKRPVQLPTKKGDRVAVITAQGNMLPGDQPPGTIGGDSLAHLIRSTGEEEGVAAIVLRINTGGGSLFASEIIRQALLDVRAEGTPVVVSMGAVAASGGYYIAAEADEIFATPSTITGSIGVFAAFPTFEELMERGGIHTDGVGTTELAGSLRLDRSLHPQIEASLNASIGFAYQSFLQIVAQGRDMSPEEASAAAEGRVWSAQDALEIGLVDSMGDLEDAIAAAAARADLDDYEVDYILPSLSPAEMVLQQMAERVGGLQFWRSSSSLATLNRLIQPLTDAADEIASLQDPRHIYMRCLSCGAVR